MIRKMKWFLPVFLPSSMPMLPHFSPQYFFGGMEMV